ncbi:MAG: metalloregulator ArsR/SmtB family transcription factor [Actinobacteria bacterium]|nr:metalloregulator ArsR/SmtB family transcription factor [Actinomycetota bacterium]
MKSALFEEFARLGGALSSAKRLELLDLLCQRERTVESLARLTGMGVTNTSQHLQSLKAARLVEARREGTRSFYRVPDPAVCGFVYEMQRLGRARLAEADRLARELFDGALEPVGRKDLLRRVRRKDVVVIDVRPKEEYEAGHIRGALSIPLGELKSRLAEIPSDAEIVAYCRGPFCVLAPQALEVLHDAGIGARRLDGGLPEWRAAGYPVEVGR